MPPAAIPVDMAETRTIQRIRHQCYDRHAHLTMNAFELAVADWQRQVSEHHRLNAAGVATPTAATTLHNAAPSTRL